MEGGASSHAGTDAAGPRAAAAAPGRGRQALGTGGVKVEGVVGDWLRRLAVLGNSTQQQE